MATFSTSNVKITAKGLAAISKWAAGEAGTIYFTRAEAGTGRISTSLENATVITSPITINGASALKIVGRKSPVVVGNTTVYNETRFTLQISNDEITTTYHLQQIGLYAKVKDNNDVYGNEFLYAIAQCDEGAYDTISPNDDTPSVWRYTITVVHTNAPSVTVDVSLSGLAYKRDLDELSDFVGYHGYSETDGAGGTESDVYGVEVDFNATSREDAYKRLGAAEGASSTTFDTLQPWKRRRAILNNKGEVICYWVSNNDTTRKTNSNLTYVTADDYVSVTENEAMLNGFFKACSKGSVPDSFTYDTFAQNPDNVDDTNYYLTTHTLLAYKIGTTTTSSDILGYGVPFNAALTTKVTLNGNVDTVSIGTYVQVMVEQPKFYCKAVVVNANNNTLDGNGYAETKSRYYICDKPREGFTLHPLFKTKTGEVSKVYLPAFLGSAYNTNTTYDGSSTTNVGETPEIDVLFGEGYVANGNSGLFSVSGKRYGAPSAWIDYRLNAGNQLKNVYGQRNMYVWYAIECPIYYNNSNYSVFLYFTEKLTGDSACYTEDKVVWQQINLMRIAYYIAHATDTAHIDISSKTSATGLNVLAFLKNNDEQTEATKLYTAYDATVPSGSQYVKDFITITPGDGIVESGTYSKEYQSVGGYTIYGAKFNVAYKQAFSIINRQPSMWFGVNKDAITDKIDNFDTLNTWYSNDNSLHGSWKTSADETSSTFTKAQYLVDWESTIDKVGAEPIHPSVRFDIEDSLNSTLATGDYTWTLNIPKADTSATPFEYTGTVTLSTQSKDTAVTLMYTSIITKIDTDWNWSISPDNVLILTAKGTDILSTSSANSPKISCTLFTNTVCNGSIIDSGNTGEDRTRADITTVFSGGDIAKEQTYTVYLDNTYMGKITEPAGTSVSTFVADVYNLLHGLSIPGWTITTDASTSTIRAVASYTGIHTGIVIKCTTTLDAQESSYKYAFTTAKVGATGYIENGAPITGNYTEVLDETKNILSSIVGVKPLTTVSINKATTLATNRNVVSNACRGWTLYTYYAQNALAWLALIEYADFDITYALNSNKKTRQSNLFEAVNTYGFINILPRNGETLNYGNKTILLTNTLAKINGDSTTNYYTVSYRGQEGFILGFCTWLSGLQFILDGSYIYPQIDGSYADTRIPRGSFAFEKFGWNTSIPISFLPSTETQSNSSASTITGGMWYGNTKTEVTMFIANSIWGLPIDTSCREEAKSVGSQIGASLMFVPYN